MFEVLVIVALVLLVLMGAGALVLRREPKGWLDKISGERVLVHTVDNQTIEGALISVLRDGIVLRAPRLIDDQPVNVAGDVFVPRQKVALVQRIGDSR